MNVYIIGAGVSKSAGYPLGNELLNRLAKFENSSREVNGKEQWKEFETWLQKQRNIIPRCIRDSGNPEFILTYIDLGIATFEHNRKRWWDQQISAIRSDDAQQAKSLNRKLKDIYNERIQETERIRRILTSSLTKYLLGKHCEDNQNNEKRKFIKKFCDKRVKGGDVVITFNYDFLVERCLLELGKWSISDGYGFPVKLVQNTWRNPSLVTLPKSPVKVLKLHGSVGWFYNENSNNIFLRYASFLQYFDKLSNYRDKKEPDSQTSYFMPPAVIEPSFIKRLDIPELLIIWEQAASALGSADKVYIIGYSLPQADITAQSLITTNLRINNKCEKIVVNPDGQTLLKYEKLLGSSVKKVECTFEDWVKKDFQR